MFKLELYALVAGILASLIVSSAIVWVLLGQRRVLVKRVAAILVFGLLVGPSSIGSWYVLDWKWTRRGESTASAAGEIMRGLSPPESSRVRFLKRHDHETWMCLIDESSFLDWCRTNRLNKAEHASSPGYSEFRADLPNADPDVVFVSESTPNGAFMAAYFYRAEGLMVYEAGYW